MAILLPIEPLPGVDLIEQANRMTDDDFFFFCQENKEYTFERNADGRIIPMAQTGGETGRRNSELTAELTLWNRQQKIGIVFDSSTGFRLPNGATRGPDAAWVSNDRWNALTPGQRKRFPPLCPDFVTELLSESDNLDATETKLREYIANGCRLGWLIDPRTEEMRIYRADGSVSVLHGFDQAVTGESVLAGFSFELRLLR